MKKVFLAVIFSSIFWATWAYGMDNPSAGSDAKAEEAGTWNFGRINAGDIAKHEFVLKNESGTILNIKDVTTSCGCTTSKLKKSELGPGESTTVEVSFNSKGFGGAVRKIVYVKTDSSDVFKSLSVDAKMTAPEAAPVQQAGQPAPAVDNSIIRLIIKGEVIRAEPEPVPAAQNMVPGPQVKR